MRAVGTALVALAVGVGSAGAQDPPPDGDWRTFRTDHFRVTYQAELEPLARHAAAVAERTHAVLREELVSAPRGLIDLVVTDHADFSNGFATPFSSNRIVVYARPPLATASLGFARDWLELVVAHELVHTFHLDDAGPVGRAIRSVLGRVPMVWPLFPALGTPLWSIEGLATYYESRLTGAGRVHGSYHDMVIRMAALEDVLPRLRDVSAPNPVWPGGERSYIYGAAFMDWLAARYGPEAHAELVDATSNALLPTFLFFDRIARGPLGRPFSDLFDDWRIATMDSAHAVRDRIEAEGITTAATVAGRGPYAVAPRFAPDGRMLAYTAHDYRSEPATRLVDLETGADRPIARRNQFGGLLGPASWLPDGSAVITAQLEHRGPHRIYSDLYRIDLDGRERRLTHGQRLAQPDVAPDGREVAAVQTHSGAIRLVVVDPESTATHVLLEAAPGDGFAAPRWSPDGRSVAVVRYEAGRTDIVVVDPATGVALPITSDESLTGAPTWSPDGRWIVFSSDRTGIPNLFAAPAPGPGTGVPDGGIRQMTNVLGGAFDPEISPDGSSIFFSAYQHDGWRIERIPFDPDDWREPGPLVMEHRAALLPEPRQAMEVDLDAAGAGTAPSRPYSPLPTIRPYFWVPDYYRLGDPASGQSLRFLGAYTVAWDVLQRHSWTGSAAYDLETGRVAGLLDWTWRGLGNPALAFRLGREWSGAGSVDVGAGEQESILVRENVAGADATIWMRRWRRTAWLTVGGDLRNRRFEGYRFSAEEFADAGYLIRDLPTIVSLSVRPGFTNARVHPYSISPQDGIATSATVRRWWNTTDGVLSYDDLRGSLALYRGYRLWGFADHVIAGRVAGVRRTGPDALPVSIGGEVGGAPDLLIAATTSRTLLPVRGFRSGDRFGTRAWVASAEYRFPLYLGGTPHRILGFSLTSASGAVFADFGDAWCTDEERHPDRIPGCPSTAPDPLAAIGAEISLGLGILTGFPLALRYGLALPLQGPGGRGPVFHAGFGPSF